MERSLDGVVTLKEPEAHQVAGYLRRVAPHGHEEENELLRYISFLEGRPTYVG